MVAHTLNQHLRGRGGWISCGSETNMVYRVCSRPAKAAQGDPISKTNKNQPTNQQQMSECKQDAMKFWLGRKPIPTSSQAEPEQIRQRRWQEHERKTSACEWAYTCIVHKYMHACEWAHTCMHVCEVNT